MADLIVVGFKKDMFRASEVLNKLTQLNDYSTLDLYDAVAVYRANNGTLRVDQRYQQTADQGAARGTLLGVLIGLLLAIPFTGGGSAAAAGVLAGGAVGGGTLGAASGALSAVWEKGEFGISDKFIKKVGDLVRPGDSAIFVLAQATNPAKLTEQFRGYGGTVLQTTLSTEQAKQVEQVLAAQR